MGPSVNVPDEIRKIFDCVDNDDVEGLKVLMESPNIFQIEDTSGYTILQRAIKDKRIAVFDFLLSFDCPINACNSEGKTPLDIARGIYDTPQHFTYSLVKNGADIHCDYKGSSLLHYALIHNYLDLDKLLIEKGADLNCQDNYGRTPLHLFIKFNPYNDINEMLAMMLYLGADFSIPDDDNEKAIDFVFNSHRLSESMQENLAFYYFDDVTVSMESRIFDCINNNDVEGLKLLLMHYPNLFQIEDASGLTILQRAIFNESFAVFDFLLSLDGYPINARNSKGKTAVQFALENYTDGAWMKKFIFPLIKKGAHVDLKNSQESRALEYALLGNCHDVVRCLIEKCWDLNYQDSSTGETLFHRVIRHLPYCGEELLAMMLYFGGDPSIPDFCGFTPIDIIFKNNRVHLSQSMLEHLIFYLFDDYYYPCYNIPIGNFFDLLNLESPLVHQILKHIFNNGDIKGWEPYWKKMFTIKPEHLKLLLEKFDYVIKAVLDASLECSHFTKILIFQDISIENFDLLFQSQFSSDIIQIINNERPSIYLITQVERGGKPHSDIFDIILFLLSYGVNIYDSDLKLIYEKFGDCEFFRMLLHMDIKINEFERCKNDIMPGLLYNVHFMDIETFLSDPNNKYKCSANAVEQLLNYFVNPKLQDLCCPASVLIEDIHARMKELPSVPLLVELARNKVRKFLIQKYKIKNSMQFYTLIKHLPISKIHQKIITLETKLY